MKRLSIATVIVATVIVAVATTAILASANRCLASAKDAQKQPGVIALVNFSEIFKNDPAHKEKMSTMKADMQSATEEVKQEKTKLEHMAGQLKILVRGTPEYNKLEERLAKDASALRVKVGLQKRNFVQREAQLLLTVYEQVTEQIDKYARTHGVDVVLNFASTPPDTQNPQAIVSHINRPVVWRDNEIDITGEISRMMLEASESTDARPAPDEPLVTDPKPDDPKARKKPANDDNEPKTQKPEKSRKKKPKQAKKTKPAKGKPVDAEDASEPEETAKPKEPPKADKPAAQKRKVVVMRIAGSYPEGPAAMGLFGELESSLGSVVRRLDAAAKDEDVAAVWLKVGGLAIGRGKLSELRAAIARVRQAKKPVYAEITGSGPAEYLLAAACGRVVMPSSGMLIIPGVRAELTFYKGLLDKLGIQFDMLQMGKFKGAAEPYTRTSMSPALRESMEALVVDIYEGMVGQIAADRKLDEARVKNLLDKGMFTATAAKKARLIDHIAYTDQVEKLLKKKLKADELELVTNYQTKKVDTDFSGISGMMKLMKLMMGGEPTGKPSDKPKIAVVYAVGPIVEGKSVSDIFGNQALGSSTLVAALKKADKDPKVKAIVLRINSPGGSAIASDLIWHETRQIEKPIIASMGDVAGSGGYYIAMGADKIFATPGTITGSIGVVGGKIVAGGLYKKLGITTEVISRGKVSGAFSTLEPFSPDERKAVNTLLRETYRQFVRKAAKGRGISNKELRALAQGRVYTGRMAAENGLVDELGTLRDAITAAKEAAGIKSDEEVELLILPKAKTIFEQMFSQPEVSSSLKEAGEVLDIARQARIIKQLFTEPTLLWMPYKVELR